MEINSFSHQTLMPQFMKTTLLSYIGHIHILQNKVSWTQVRYGERSVKSVLTLNNLWLNPCFTRSDTMAALAGSQCSTGSSQVLLPALYWMLPYCCWTPEGFHFFSYLFFFSKNFLLPLYHLSPSQFFLLLMIFLPLFSLVLPFC